MADFWLLVKVILALAPVIRETYRQVKSGHISSPEEYATGLHEIMVANANAKTAKEKQDVAQMLHDHILKG